MSDPKYKPGDIVRVLEHNISEHYGAFPNRSVTIVGLVKDREVSGYRYIVSFTDVKGDIHTTEVNEEWLE